PRGAMRLGRGRHAGHHGRARRSWLTVLATLGLLTGLLLPAVRVVAATVTLTGSVALDAKIALSGNAVVVVTLFDQTASAEAGSVIGLQRLDGVSAVPVPFAVPYDDARIDPKHSYAVIASIVDGATEYVTAQPTPVITGGPTEGVELTVGPQPQPKATITGTIERPADVTLTADGEALAVLIKAESGTLVDVDTIVDVTGTGPIAFTLAYDPELIDPTAHYVVRAGIQDEGHVWGSPEAPEVIADGNPVANQVDLRVVERPEGIPSDGEPTPPPSAT